MKAKLIITGFGLILITACTPNQVEVEDPKIVEVVADTLVEIVIDTSVQQSLRSHGLVDILSIDSTLIVDLKYATSDNFMGFVLYDTLNAVYLQEDVAVKLAACQAFLKDTLPTHSLLVYDGVRPLRCVVAEQLGL